LCLERLIVKFKETMASKQFFKTQIKKDQMVGDFTLFVQYSDYTVSEWNVVHQKVSKLGLTIERIKNSKAIKQLSGGSYEKISFAFHGPMAMINCPGSFSSQLLKDILKFTENQSKMHLVCAMLHKQIVFPITLKKWSKLPSDEELFMSLVGVCNRPAQRMTQISNQGMQMLCSDLDKYIKHGDQ
jgi:ribosomal protein L10